MNSARWTTATTRLAISFNVVVLVIAFASAARGQATPDLFTRVETLTLSDGTPASGIASISGNTAVVGDDGVVQVFRRERDGDHWLHTATLTPSDGTSRFGRSVAVDGKTIVVGADSAAFVFERTRGLGWQEVQKLTGDTNAFSFAESVAVSGTTVVVGAPQSSITRPGMIGDPGLAYVFERDEGGASAWGEIARLRAHSLIPPGFLGLPDLFGWSVSIDRDQVVAGAERGQNFPTAYVFSRDHGGPNAWGMVATLPVISGPFGIPDAVAARVSISGNTVIAGSPQLTHAHLFSRDQGGGDAWGAIVDVTAAPPFPFFRTGSVSISRDLAVVGGGTNAGASVFGRNQGALDSWGEVARIFLGVTGALDVAISGDTTLVVNRVFNPPQQTPIEVYVADSDRDGLRDGADPCPRDPLNNVAGGCQRASAVHAVLDELLAQGDVTSETQGRRQIITATFTNTSDTAVQNPFFEVTELTGHNVLLNGDAGRGRIGATLSPDVGDGILSPGESMTVTFRIRLRTSNPFQFFVTLHGDPVP